MSAFAMVSGRLFGEPVRRETKTGSEAVYFKLKVGNGSSIEFWSIACFPDRLGDDLVLDDLYDGAALSVVGQLNVSTYQWNNETRLDRKLVADRILPLKAPPMETKRRRRATRQPRRSRRAERTAIPLSVKVGGDEPRA
jgi:hypothetical protein